MSSRKPVFLAELRRRLHRAAEPSNAETRTAQILRDELAATSPDELVGDLGGHGIAAIYSGSAPGATALLRADMDAVPVAETGGLDYASERADVSHKCGHDGHMAMLVGAARKLGRSRPERGTAVLLFQPAEETGQGARRVLEDSRFAGVEPTRVLALHNLPGEPIGRVVVRAGPFASASRGMIVELSGVSSHAAQPHAGISPVQGAAAIAQSIESAPQRAFGLDDCVQATVVGIDVGGPAFGTSPGKGRVMATLRAHREQDCDRLAKHCAQIAHGIAAAHRLSCDIAWTDVFPATENAPEIADIVTGAAGRLGLSVASPPTPFPWSEDFGHFTARYPGALFGLGSGLEQPPLHHPDYDFPDELLPTGTALLLECLPELLA